MQTRRRPRRLGLPIGVLTALVVASIAGGTSGNEPRLKPGQLPINDPGDVLTRDINNSRRWTLRAGVRMFGNQPRAAGLGIQAAPTQPIKFDTAQFVYPLIGETSMSVPYPEEARMRLQLDKTVPNDRRKLMPDGRWPINERVITNLYDTLPGYQGPTSLMSLSAENVESNSLLFQIELDVRTWETRIDEERADAIEWPVDPWPPVLVSALEPQLYINPEHAAVQDLLAIFLNGKDPRDVRPYALAKHLAGRVVEYIEFNDTSLHVTGRSTARGVDPTVLINGFRLEGSINMAIHAEGSRYDAATLLCALYRAAGLPARIVIGLDVDPDPDGFRPLDQPNQFDFNGDGVPVLRSWVEFALLDDERDVTEWIPVDIARQRDFSDRAPALDRRWQFFGHNEEFDFVIPISHHWHPPTTVTNDGPPALWGWLPEPVVPDIDSEVLFDARETATRGDDPVDPYRR